MYPGGLGNIALVLGVVNVVWLLALSYFVWKHKIFLEKLFPNKQGNFKDKLEEVLKEIEAWQQFKEISLGYVQKVFLKRYNPYQDTGGDQSFSAAFLDGRGDGLVITSLHSRAGTRVFAKPVKNGHNDKVQFSQEEEEVVKEATR